MDEIEVPSGLPDQELAPEEGRRPARWRRLIAWGLRQGARVGRSLRRKTGRDESSEDWPATQLEKISGDEFGNGAEYLWRCLSCGGYFIHPGQYGYQFGAMGLVNLPTDEEAAQIDRERSVIRRLADLLAQESPCKCDYHPEPENFFGGLFR